MVGFWPLIELAKQRIQTDFDRRLIKDIPNGFEQAHRIAQIVAWLGISAAQMDENQIFYLMSRGLNREGAKREIVSGFLEPLSRKMGPAIRAWINYLIENKWSGKSLILKTDEAMEQILEVEKSRYRETQDIFEKHYKYR